MVFSRSLLTSGLVALLSVSLAGCVKAVKHGSAGGDSILLGDGVYQEGTAITGAADGGYVIAGQRTDAGTELPGPSVYVIRLDADLEVVWEQVYHTPETYLDLADSYASDVVTSVDGQAFFVAGRRSPALGEFDDGYVIRISADTGDLEASYTYQTEGALWNTTYLSEHFESVWPTRDGGCLVAGAVSGGFAGNANIIVVKLSSTLDEQWVRRIEADHREWGNGVMQTKEGMIFVGGRSTVDEQTNNVLYRLDLQGYVIDFFSYEAPGDQNLARMCFAYRESLPGISPRWGEVGALLLGSSRGTSEYGIGSIDHAEPVIHLVDAGGGLKWQTILPAADGHRELLGATRLDNGGAVLVGYTAESVLGYQSRDGIVYRIDRDGQLLGDPVVVGDDFEDVLHDVHGNVAVGVSAAGPGIGKRVWVVELTE